jgi:hypothetical protein
MRRMPRCLALEDRLRFQTILTSADVAIKSFDELCKFIESKKDIIITEHANNLDLTPLIIYTWTIIDQIHIVREVIKSLPNLGPLSLEYIEKTKNFTLIRNRMDHISSILNNLANRKGSHDPLHGQLMVGIPINKELIRYVIIPLSPMHNEKQVGPVIDTQASIPNSFEDSIVFQAFDFSVHLTYALEKTKEWLVKNNDVFEECIKNQLFQLSMNNKSVNIEEELKNTITGNIFMAMDVKHYPK